MTPIYILCIIEKLSSLVIVSYNTETIILYDSKYCLLLLMSYDTEPLIYLPYYNNL